MSFETMNNDFLDLTASSGGSGGGGTGGTTPAEKSAIKANTAKTALIDGTTAINFDEIILDGDRATNSDIDDPKAVPETLLRFISISGLRHAIEQMKSIFMPMPDADNPAVTLNVGTAGSTAKMEVYYDGYNVANMEWDKATEEFVVNLADKASGTIQNTFTLKQDGNAYVNGKKVSTGTPVPPTADGEYKLKVAAGVATWVTV